MKNEITKKLDEIMRHLQDDYSCYTSHIDKIKQPALKELFIYLSKQRQKMKNEIKKEIESSGEKPNEGGTLIGTLHSFYENLKHIILQGNPLAITKEIIHSENILLEEYKNVLACHISEDLKRLLLKQFNQVEDEIKETDNTAIKAAEKTK